MERRTVKKHSKKATKNFVMAEDSNQPKIQQKHHLLLLAQIIRKKGKRKKGMPKPTNKLLRAMEKKC